MAHIAVNEQFPGIVGLLHFRPETAAPLNQYFCHTSHGAAAAHHYGGDLTLIDEINAGLPNTDLSPKMRALLDIAAQVQRGGLHVTTSPRAFEGYTQATPK
jgi:hypothetical protein